MTTSQSTPFLSKPSGEAQIKAADLAYISARGRQQAFNFVHSELKKSGISRATLARRLGKAPEVVSRLLKRPSNWEQDTISELVFAISGASFVYQKVVPAASERPQVSRTPARTTTNQITFESRQGVVVLEPRTT